ncbi:MAG: arginine decarboxylase [Firmicutes bacterium]|nr:arginine decarboxylase [Bacillota bacterium]
MKVGSEQGRTPLREALETVAAGGRLRLHTPGHAGHGPRGPWPDPYWDLTEVGPVPAALEASQAAAATAYGTRATWFSAQGATLPVQAAVLGAFAGSARPVWVDRASHRAVAAALLLGGIPVRWRQPRLGPGGVPLPAADPPPPGVAGAVLTRPTYDGLLTAQDLPDGGPVVADEAHGAHWYCRPGYPASALELGADLVIHGSHKTEAAPTGTALLHLAGGRVEPAAVRFWWETLASSSPSYPLLAGLEAMVAARFRPPAAAAWAALAAGARELRDRLAARGWVVLQRWWEERGGLSDPARLTLLGRGAAALVRAAGLEPEKETPASVTLILTPHLRLEWVAQRLLALPVPEPPPLEERPWPLPAAALPMREALTRGGEWVELAAAPGRVSRGWVIPYPPGIPLILPGERWDAEVVAAVREAGTAEGLEEGRVWVLR